MVEILDTAIIGGGPTGAAAALSLRQLLPAARITIFESSAGSHWRPGETLAPGAADLLRSLGCWDAFRRQGFLESFGTRAAWDSATPHDNDFVFSLHGNGWRLVRSQFDRMLLDCASAAGIEVRDSARLRESSASEAGWRLRFQHEECEARFVVDATGRAATFAVQRGARRIAGDHLAAAVVRFEGVENADTLIEAQPEGWWYSTTVSGSVAIAAFMSDTDLIRKMQLHDPTNWNARLEASTLTRERLRAARPIAEPAIFAANSQRLDRMGGKGWVAAGDAAMVFDPLSSQGILKALRSGKLASFVAADFLQRGVDSHARYEAIALAEYRGYEETKRDYYAREKRWSQAPFWRRRSG